MTAPRNTAIAQARPVSVRLGFTHVSVTRGVGGWVAVAWSPASDGPVLLPGLGNLAQAIDEARAYTSLSSDRLLYLDGINDPGGDGGQVHVLRTPHGLEVHHEGRGGSWGYLRCFALADAKRAVRYALSVCPGYGSRLGRLEMLPVPASDGETA
jgi:hypothetical protein